jgi:hypothetical protein
LGAARSDDRRSVFDCDALRRWARRKDTVHLDTVLLVGMAASLSSSE